MTHYSKATHLFLYFLVLPDLPAARLVCGVPTHVGIDLNLRDFFGAKSCSDLSSWHTIHLASSC